MYLFTLHTDDLVVRLEKLIPLTAATCRQKRDCAAVVHLLA